MSYSDELRTFRENHPYREISVGNVTFRCLCEGPTGAPTLVFLNGGTNTSEMWMQYVEPCIQNFRVLLFDYPIGLNTNQELAAGMNALFRKLNIEKPILIGASDGGFVAQIYVQKYPNDVGAMALLSTGGLDANTLKSLKKKYFFAPAMIWYMKRCNYEKLKPKMIKLGVSNAKNESPEVQAYVRDLFESIFAEYTKEKDVHATGLLADLLNQTPATRETFRALAGRILLILPDKDFFSPKMQADLIELMHNPQVEIVKGGHLSTILHADEYIRVIFDFLNSIGINA